MQSQVDTGNPPQDNNKEDSNSKQIKVHIAIFFDGTGNSMMNVKERKAYDAQATKTKQRDDYYKSNDSHLNDLSNVAKLYTMYRAKMNKGNYNVSIYIEGIGTAPRSVAEETYCSQYFNSKGKYDDSTIGQAFGCGEYGVNGKIERGCQKIKNCLLDILKKENDPNIEIELTLDAYGFSRGAAAARSFTSRIKEAKGDTFSFGKVLKDELETLCMSLLIPFPSSTFSTIKKYLAPIFSKENRYQICLMNVLDEEQIKLSKDIEVSFLGLYDTVSSYGESFNDDVNELALTIDDSIVKNVYQICAADEYRKNFSLTLVEPFANNVIIPGAHSDIGGGYSDNKQEKYILYKNYYSVVRVMGAMAISPALITAPLKSNIYAGNKDSDELKNGGWFSDEDIKNGFRTVSNSYSCIALNMMRDKSGSSKFKMKDEYKVSKNKDLNSFYNQLKAKKLYAFKGNEGEREIKRIVPEVSDLEKKIRNKYLHLSSQGESLKMIALSPESLIGERRFVNAAQPGNIRKIIENK